MNLKKDVFLHVDLLDFKYLFLVEAAGSEISKFVGA